MTRTRHAPVPESDAPDAGAPCRHRECLALREALVSLFVTRNALPADPVAIRHAVTRCRVIAMLADVRHGSGADAEMASFAEDQAEGLLDDVEVVDMPRLLARMRAIGAEE